MGECVSAATLPRAPLPAPCTLACPVHPCLPRAPLPAPCTLACRGTLACPHLDPDPTPWCVGLRFNPQFALEGDMDSRPNLLNSWSKGRGGRSLLELAALGIDPDDSDGEGGGDLGARQRALEEEMIRRAIAASVRVGTYLGCGLRVWFGTGSVGLWKWGWRQQPPCPIV